VSTVQTARIPTPIDAKADHVPEPYLLHTFLPRCANCSAPHPAARKPVPSDSSTCLECGAPVQTGQTVEVAAPRLGGVWGFVATSLFNAARWLRRLAKEV
jgi:hypothetical protein